MTGKALLLCGAALVTGPALAAPGPGGAPRLEDFRIDDKGVVTRPAEPTPTPAPTPAPAEQPAPEPTPAPRAEPSATPAARAPEERAERPAPRVRTPTEASPLPEPLPTPTASPELPVDAPLSAPTSDAVESSPLLPQPTPAPDAAVASTPAPPVEGGPAWPWLLLPLALAGIGIAAWRFRRRPPAPSTSIDLMAGTDTPDLAEPVPVAAVAPTPPAPARPQVELALTPEAATLNEGELEVRFTLAMRNTGDAPARDIRLASKLMSGGLEVNDALSGFYADGLDRAVRLPQELPPGGAGSIRGRVRLKTDEMKVLTVKDRSLLVPLIAVNLRYGWDGGEGQTAQSFVLGRELDPPSPRMAPLPITEPPRVYKGLGTRPHALALVA